MAVDFGRTGLLVEGTSPGSSNRLSTPVEGEVSVQRDERNKYMCFGERIR